MSILSGWLKTRAYRKTADGYKKESRDTSSETVYMNDGNTAETNLGDIKGITDSLTATSSNVALSAKGGNSLQGQIDTLNNSLGIEVHEHDSTKRYFNGDMVLHDGKLYTTKASVLQNPVPITGQFSLSLWEEVNAIDLIKKLHYGSEISSGIRVDYSDYEIIGSPDSVNSALSKLFDKTKELNSNLSSVNDSCFNIINTNYNTGESNNVSIPLSVFPNGLMYVYNDNSSESCLLCKRGTHATILASTNTDYNIDNGFLCIIAGSWYSQIYYHKILLFE